MIRIRQETKKDWKDTEITAREAFWDLYRPGCVEHLTARRLHEDPSYEPALSFVAYDDDAKKQIGFILASRARIEGNAKERKIYSLVSLAVLPKWQGRGVGRRLIHEAMKAAQNHGADALIAIGKPSYFRPFGFRPASDFHLLYEGLEGDVIPFFMIRVFHKKLDYRGIYRENPALAVTAEEADAFDKNFPPKEKHVFDWQLL